MEFKLTYATMFNPPEELHTHFDAGLARVKADLGKEYAMIIDNKDVFASDKFEDRSPINTDWLLAVMQKGNEKHARQALAAARKAFPGWSHTPWQNRVNLLRKAADLIEERMFEMGPAMALEVGKNRMECLGDIAETADLIRYACDQMEANNGYIVEMGKDPLVGLRIDQYFCAAPLWSLAGDQPVQFPLRINGRSHWCGARHREYHCHQTSHRFCLDRPPAGRMLPRRRSA